MSKCYRHRINSMSFSKCYDLIEGFHSWAGAISAGWLVALLIFYILIWFRNHLGLRKSTPTVFACAASSRLFYLLTCFALVLWCLFSGPSLRCIQLSHVAQGSYYEKPAKTCILFPLFNRFTVIPSEIICQISFWKFELEIILIQVMEMEHG